MSLRFHPRRALCLLAMIFPGFLCSPVARAAPQTRPAKLNVGLGAEHSSPGSPPPVPLKRLLQEAEHDNPRIIAAERAWQAAAKVPSQVSALPDPEFTVQQFAVGSPRPFAGFTNSNFGYIGFGISQRFPYPGKLRLRGEIAEQSAGGMRDRIEAVRRDIAENLKTAYYRLAYQQEVLRVLGRDQQTLRQIEKIAEARYRAGQGNEQDVLEAQLQQTKLLPEIEVQHQLEGSAEAQLKQVLNRAPDSPDFAAQELTETPFTYSFDQLLARARSQNPDLRARQQSIRSRGLEVALARKDFYPDFDAQYMWQHTAGQFRDYYMLSFGVQIPLHWGSRQRPHLAQETEELDRSRRDYEAGVQQTSSEIREQCLAAKTDARVLTIYRQGLIPQARAAFEAGLASYQTGKEDFQSLLHSFRDVLDLESEYWRTLADHETALAKLEQLTGINLP